MGYSQLVSSMYIFVCLISCCSVILAQQPYIRKATTACHSKSNSTSVLGYTCNGVNRSCQAYLTFRAQPQYNTVSTISKFLSVDPLQLSQLNSVAESATFDTDQMVLVPVNCSCSGQYYQLNTSYVVQDGDTYLTTANNTYQGLSTCQSILAQNSNTFDVGTRIIVPLRCACPTKNQIDNGVKYLLSYLVTWGQSVSRIGTKFGVSTRDMFNANELSEQDSTIYPFTTLLVPLQDPPSSSQVARPPPQPSSPPSITPPPVPPPSGGSDKTWVYAVVGVLGGLIIVSVGGTIIFCMFFRKTRKETAKPTTSYQTFELNPLNKKKDEESQDFWEGMSSLAHSLKVYTLEELRAATDEFSPSCLIKGSVYRGNINGDFAAIKKMNGDVSKEITLLAKINHFNLIRLSGVCFSDGDRYSNCYLVYEYAVNGPLSDWIHNVGQKFLTWNQRLQIALDIATGLNYLHHYTSPPHVHKDLNSSNILLDGDFRAKITNFGLARSTAGQEGQFAVTRHIVGTKGYMAPEYLENGLISTKLDVHAFGILLLEILTGKEVAQLYEGIDTELSEMLIPVLHEENGKQNLRNVMDSLLQGNYPSELAMSLLRLIDNCLKKEPSHRPSMEEILQSLSRISASTLSYESTVSIQV